MGKRKNARHIAPSVLVLGEASQAFPEIVEILDNDSGTLLDLIQRPLPNTKFGKNLAIEDNMFEPLIEKAIEKNLLKAIGRLTTDMVNVPIRAIERRDAEKTAESMAL